MTSETLPDEPIRLAIADGIATITLNRPPANALSMEGFRTLGAIADRLSADESVRVAILTAEGSRIFSGGADVKELRTHTADQRAEFFAVSSSTRRKFSAISIPVIAAINGSAAGAGITYPTFCDYRIAADHALFNMPEIDRGSVAGGGMMFLAIGVLTGPMRMMLYTGQRITAHQALAMHLVDEVVPSENLQSVALERAQAIASKPRHALVAMKQAIARMSANPVWSEENYASAQQMNLEMINRPETQEGYAAFFEKRRPSYDD